MADTVVRAIMNLANDGEFMADETQTRQVAQAIDICEHLITFVDHLFDALVRAHLDAVVEKDTRVVDVPPLVARAREAVEAARARLRAEASPGA
jgi:hypothetical protein